MKLPRPLRQSLRPLLSQRLRNLYQLLRLQSPRQRQRNLYQLLRLRQRNLHQLLLLCLQSPRLRPPLSSPQLRRHLRRRLQPLRLQSPRRLLRLKPVRIEAGSAADLTLVDPERVVHVTPDYLEGKSKNSAFLGLTLKGCACDVFVDGKHTLVDGKVVS